MNKLYVFGIGGTGSRVLKSLTMLLAAGVQINYEVVPIIIDPDIDAADLTRTTTLMDNYAKVHKSIDTSDKSKNMFFRTKIDLTTINNENNGRITIQGVEKKFEDYIGLPHMSEGNKALASMLFSEKNLSSNTRQGFKGNPNIGSVVLNQIFESDEFKKFENAATDEKHRIFVISSIFGGTGASGFPLLVKKIRKEKKKEENHVIRNLPIGAVTILPYFNVGIDPDQEGEINSATFISKTNAALYYYEKNLNEVN